jgi:hypothetical protein
VKRVVYLFITEDYEVAKHTKEALERKKGWKLITKYYKETADKEPSHVTSEEVRA